MEVTRAETVPLRALRVRGKKETDTLMRGARAAQMKGDSWSTDFTQARS